MACLPRLNRIYLLTSCLSANPPLQATYENLKDKIFVAERALLYALNFQFAVDHAYQVRTGQCRGGALPCGLGPGTSERGPRARWKALGWRAARA